MDPWAFGWPAVASIGQVLIAGIAIWAALRPSRKKLNISLVYIYTGMTKTEAMHIANECGLPITITDAGIYARKCFKRYKISFEENGFKINPCPLTLEAYSNITLSHLLDMRESYHGNEERFYAALYPCMLPAICPIPEKKKPRISLYVKAADGKIYKKYIGAVSEICSRANDR